MGLQEIQGEGGMLWDLSTWRSFDGLGVWRVVPMRGDGRFRITIAKERYTGGEGRLGLCFLIYLPFGNYG